MAHIGGCSLSFGCHEMSLWGGKIQVMLRSKGYWRLSGCLGQSGQLWEKGGVYRAWEGKEAFVLEAFGQREGYQRRTEVFRGVGWKGSYGAACILLLSETWVHFLASVLGSSKVPITSAQGESDTSGFCVFLYSCIHTLTWTDTYTHNEKPIKSLKKQ